jgi:hypothetical protein
MNDQRLQRVHAALTTHSVSNFAAAVEPIDASTFVPKSREWVVAAMYILGALLLIGAAAGALLLVTGELSADDYGGTSTSEGY